MSGAGLWSEVFGDDTGPMLNHEKPLVRRKDIRIEEHTTHEDQTYSGTVYQYNWSAELRGQLSTGEEVAIEPRYANSAADAIAALEATIAKQGWDLR